MTVPMTFIGFVQFVAFCIVFGFFAGFGFWLCNKVFK